MKSCPDGQLSYKKRFYLFEVIPVPGGFSSAVQKDLPGGLFPQLQ